jgi:hypothetical protein
MPSGGGGGGGGFGVDLDPPCGPLSSARVAVGMATANAAIRQTLASIDFSFFIVLSPEVIAE